MGLDISSYDPLSLAKQAMGATATGSWLNTGGAAIGGVANAIAGGYQARVAANNAVLSDYDATNTLAAGRLTEEQSRIKTSQTIAAERTGQAGGNIDVGSGSALKVQEDQQKLGDFDAQLIRYNAERGAYNDRAQAKNYRTQSGLDALATGFGVARDAGKTYASYISGSTALANQALSFRQVGGSLA